MQNCARIQQLIPTVHHRRQCTHSTSISLGLAPVCTSNLDLPRHRPSWRTTTGAQLPCFSVAVLCVLCATSVANAHSVAGHDRIEGVLAINVAFLDIAVLPNLSRVNFTTLAGTLLDFCMPVAPCALCAPTLVRPLLLSLQVFGVHWNQFKKCVAPGSHRPVPGALEFVTYGVKHIRFWKYDPQASTYISSALSFFLFHAQPLTLQANK